MSRRLQTDITSRVQVRQFSFTMELRMDIQRKNDLNFNPNWHHPEFAPDITFPPTWRSDSTSLQIMHMNLDGVVFSPEDSTTYAT